MAERKLLSNGILLHGYSNSESLKELRSSKLINPMPPFSVNGSDLTIVILSFNRVSFTIRLIESIVRTVPGYSGKILIMDNGSTEDQIAKLETKILQHKNVEIELVKLGKNHGVAGGRNEALNYIKTDWFMSLDNDIYLIGNPLSSIKKAIDTLGVLFVNVPLLQTDGLTIDAFGGDIWLEPCEDSFYISGTSTFKQAHTYELPRIEPFMSTFLFGGASVIHKQSFIDHGGYDSNMFIGFEDTEFSLRLVKKGIRIGNATDFCFIHAHQPPRNQDDVDAEKVRFSARLIKESGEYFQKKHGLIVWRETVDSWIEEKFRELKIGEGKKPATKVSAVLNNEIPEEKQELNGKDLHIVNGSTPELPVEPPIIPVPIHTESELRELRRELKVAQEMIHAMESSKFWKIRDYWFRFRRRIGVKNDGFSLFNKRAYSLAPVIKHPDTIVEHPYQYERLLKKSPYRNNNGSNVLVFIPFTVVGGAETAILQVLNGFKKSQINASLIISAHPGPGMGDTSTLFHETCPDSYVLEDYNNLWNDADNWKHWKALTLELIRQRNINTILISNSSFAYMLLEDLRSLFPHIKIINPVYSTVGHMDDNIKQEAHIDLTVVENPQVEQFLVKNCLRSPQKVKRIENGVDINKFKPVDSLVTEINGIALPAGKKILTFLGRLSEEKGPDLFVDIANRLKDREDLHFLIAGDGPMTPAVLTKMRELDLENKITFSGYTDSFQALAASHALIVPSRMDGRPNAVLESLAMGVPVIASNVGGLPWLVSDSEGTGKICAAGDINEFANAITSLIADKEKYGQMKKRCREFAVEKLDVSYMQRAYANLCNN